MSNEYYKDTMHHVKLALSGKQDKDPQGDESDRVFFIKDLAGFSETLVNSLKVVLN